MFHAIFEEIRQDMEDFTKYFSTWGDSSVLPQLGEFALWAVFILIVGWLLRKGINRSISDNNIRYRTKKVVTIASIVLVALLAIVTLTNQVRYFSIAIGIMTAGVAFALQEVILSTAGWVAIFSSHIYKTGDRIEVDGVKGDVIDIGITKTTLMEIGEWIKSDNYNGRIVQIPNSMVFTGVVRNYSTDFPFVWDEIFLPIKYGSNMDKAREIIKKAADENLADYAKYAETHWKEMVKKYVIENANVHPMISIRLNDNWAEFNLRFVVDLKKRKATKNRLFRDILDGINDSGGEVALASTTLDITSFPELNVHVDMRNTNSE